MSIDFTPPGLTPEVVTSAFTENQQERQEEISKYVGTNLSGVHDAIIELGQEAARAAKAAQEAAEVAAAARRAFLYAVQTGNVFPVFAATFNRQGAIDMAHRLGLDVPANNSDEWEVPEDFEG